MRRSHIQLFLSAVVISIGYVLVFFLGDFIAENRPNLPQSYEDQDLTLEGKRLKGWALGAEGLLADWYWMRSLQYIGDKLVRTQSGELNIDDLRPLNPRLLYPLLDNATTLDPRFMPAYSYGASVLPAIDPSQSIRLTEKGIANNPDAWRLYQYLGYIYWRLAEYEKAAEIYERGAAIKGAPAFMRQMAAAMKTQGGSRETAREMYLQMLAEAEDQQTRKNAQLRLLQIDSMEDRDAIDSALKAFQEARGRCPANFGEILPALRASKLPRGREFMTDDRGNLVDPTGVPYELDRQSCKAALGAESTIPKR